MKRILVFLLIAITFTIPLISCTAVESGEKLPTPEIISYDRKEEVLLWREVKNAQKYVVSIDGKEYETTDLNFDFSDLKGLSSEYNTYYDVKLKAKGDGKNYSSSDWAERRILINAKWDGYDEDGYYYRLYGGNQYLIQDGKANLRGEIVIPEYYRGLPVYGVDSTGFSVSGLYLDEILSTFESGERLNKVTTGIKFHSNLTYIGSVAFAGMTKITELDIPDSVTKMGDLAFAYCTSLKNLRLSNNLKTLATYSFYNCGLEQVSLPQNLQVIEPYAFANNSSLTQITIPSSIKNIENGVFNNCTSLTQISLPENLDGVVFSTNLFNYTGWYEQLPDGLAYIDDSFLYTYKGVMPTDCQIVLPSSTKYISNGAFNNQENLKSIVIPSGVRFLRNGYGSSFAFSGCKNLESVQLPSDLQTLPERLFSVCPSLKHLELPNSVTHIEKNAIFQCRGLESIKLSNNLVTIDKMAFNECTSLNNVVIPKSVKNIGIDTFKGCTALNSIYYEGTQEEWEIIAPSSHPNYATTFMGADIYFHSQTQPQTEGNFWHYDENNNPIKW